MSGYLHYQHFKNLEYRFNFNVSDMLVMNTKESPDYPSTAPSTVRGMPLLPVMPKMALTLTLQ